MTRRDVSILSARLLALALIVFGMSEVIGFAGNTFLSSAIEFDRAFWVSLISVSVKPVAGLILWASAKSFAMSIELDATTPGELEEEMDEGDEGRAGSFSSEVIVMIGSVLLGLWILSFAVAAFLTGIVELAWRPPGSLFAGGSNDVIRRQEIVGLIYSGIRLLLGIALIAGRKNIAAFFERLRYAPAHPPSRDDLSE